MFIELTYFLICEVPQEESEPVNQWSNYCCWNVPEMGEKSHKEYPCSAYVRQMVSQTLTGNLISAAENPRKRWQLNLQYLSHPWVNTLCKETEFPWVPFRYTTRNIKYISINLTHCDLDLPYDIVNVDQHGFRKWLGAWWHQTIIWTYAELLLTLLALRLEYYGKTRSILSWLMLPVGHCFASSLFY